MWALLVGGPVYLVNLQPEAPAASSTPAHAAFAYVPLVDPVSIGLTLYVLGLFIEWRADAEKAAFKHAPHSATRKPWIDTGMWALSRHPNYLGEIMLWTGISLMAADSIQQPTAATVTACVLSPLFLTLLLTRVSGIPLLEEHADKSFGHDAAYQAYKARTGVLLPLPLDRAVRFAWRLMWACTAFAAAYFCGRMFTYVAHSMKISPAAPGTTRASTGHSINRKVESGEKPRLAAERQYSAGTRSSADSIRRAASGRLKKTCAMRMPVKP